MKKKLFIGLGIVAALIFIAGVAYASTSGGVIHACVRENGEIRIVADAKYCIRGETPLQWNIVGPQGPKGDTGAPGPAGASGAQGPKGDTGATGPIGPAGPQGGKGDTGAAGPAGSQGPAGPTGDTGAPGPTPIIVSLPVSDTNCPTGGISITTSDNQVYYLCNGAKGDTGATGPAGPQGNPGQKGDTGATGSQGTSGSLVLAGQICPIGQYLMGFDNSGTPICGAIVPTLTPTPTPTPTPIQTSCTQDSDCSISNYYYCSDNGLCVAKRPDGYACLKDNECASARCIDNYCGGRPPGF